MYIPPSLIESDTQKLHEFMNAHGFATVISSASREPIASHLPILLDRDAGPHGRSMYGPEPDFIDKLLAAIVGFEIDIERLEGKWKLNQNHPAERREQIIRGLQSTGRHDELQIAELMQATLEAS